MSKPRPLTTDESGETSDCWCGVKDAWSSFEDLDDRCGGMGVLYCYCGGDFCVCHNHGEVECFGCADCEPDCADDVEMDFDDQD